MSSYKSNSTALGALELHMPCKLEAHTLLSCSPSWVLLQAIMLI